MSLSTGYSHCQVNFLFISFPNSRIEISRCLQFQTRLLLSMLITELCFNQRLDPNPTVSYLEDSEDPHDPHQSQHLPSSAHKNCVLGINVLLCLIWLMVFLALKSRLSSFIFAGKINNVQTLDSSMDSVSKPGIALLRVQRMMLFRFTSSRCKVDHQVKFCLYLIN